MKPTEKEIKIAHLEKKIAAAKAAAAKAIGNPLGEDLTSLKGKSVKDSAHAAYIHIQTVEIILKELGVTGEATA